MGSIEAENLTGFASVFLRNAGAGHPGECSAENADVVEPSGDRDEVGDGIERAEHVGDAAGKDGLGPGGRGGVGEGDGGGKRFDRHRKLADVAAEEIAEAGEVVGEWVEVHGVR